MRFEALLRSYLILIRLDCGAYGSAVVGSSSAAQGAQNASKGLVLTAKAVSVSSSSLSRCTFSVPPAAKNLKKKGGKSTEKTCKTTQTNMQ